MSDQKYPRNFLQLFNQNNAAPSFGYIYDSALTGLNGDYPFTGGWRAVTPSDVGVDSVNITGDVSINLSDVEDILRSGITETIAIDNAPDLSQSLYYDGSNQLTGVVSSSASLGLSYSEALSYDANGNLTGVVRI